MASCIYNRRRDYSCVAKKEAPSPDPSHSDNAVQCINTVHAQLVLAILLLCQGGQSCKTGREDGERRQAAVAGRNGCWVTVLFPMMPIKPGHYHRKLHPMWHCSHPRFFKWWQIMPNGRESFRTVTYIAPGAIWSRSKNSTFNHHFSP